MKDKTDARLSKIISSSAADLIRENTHRPTGPEGMTEKEKVDHIRAKYGKGMPKKRNTKP